MGECADCRSWTVQRKTLYGDGSEVVNYQAPDCKGFCEVLKIETPLEFGCNSFVAGNEHYEILGKKSGSPWHHFKRLACPDCNGRGSDGTSPCRRCCGCGLVNHYDDGYIGEEAHRRHPNEEVHKMVPPTPKCPSCNKDVQREWVGCPFCGARLIEPGHRENRVSALGGAQ